MVISRAFLSTTLGTALGLSLAGCAYDDGRAPVLSESASVAQINRTAAESLKPDSAQTKFDKYSNIKPSAGPGTGVQLASLSPMLAGEAESGDVVSEMAANPPVVQKGTVLWRRTGDEADLPPTPKVSDELRRLRDSLAQMQGDTSQQLNALQDRVQTSQKTLAQVQTDQQRQERDLRAQTTEAVANVANMAQESMRTMERVARSTSDRWFATNQQLNQLEGRLQTALADVQQQQTKANERTQAYTDLTVSKAQLENQLAAVREARQAAMEAELRAKSFTGQQLASRDQVLSGLMATTNATQQVNAAQLQAVKAETAAKMEGLGKEQAAKLAGLEKEQAAKLNAVQQMQGMQFAALDRQLVGNRELTRAQLQALQDATDTKLAAAQTLQNTQIAAVSSQLAANQQLTSMQLAELRKLNDDNRALASSETLNVAAALRQYADAQLQAASASNAATIASLAQATDQSVAALGKQTNQRLGVLWKAANQNAEKLAEQKANAVAARVVELQQQTAAQKIDPAQIRAIAEQTVAESTPEFRALALKTMQDSQDYIRTIARAAVSDKDPAMQTALADAARDVITKDDKVVFAIRKAVAEELSGTASPDSVEGTSATPLTRLGPDHDRAITSTGETDQLDPNRLRIAQLLAPGSTQPAPDAVNLAGISPAAGPTAAGTLEQKPNWSVSGTSLVAARTRADWMDIRKYKVVVHEDDQTLEDLLHKVLKRAEPFTGPWQVRWKISDQNREVLTEKFSLDAETTFEEFVSYLAQYVVNDRGVKLTFSLFDNERIILISD